MMMRMLKGAIIAIVFFKRSTNFGFVIISLSLVHSLTWMTVPLMKSCVESIACRCYSKVSWILHICSMVLNAWDIDEWGSEHPKLSTSLWAASSSHDDCDRTSRYLCTCWWKVAYTRIDSLPNTSLCRRPLFWFLSHGRWLSQIDATHVMCSLWRSGTKTCRVAMFKPSCLRLCCPSPRLHCGAIVRLEHALEVVFNKIVVVSLLASHHYLHV